MRINVWGQYDTGVPKPFTNDFRIFARRQEQGRASVAQIVQTNLFGYFGASKDWLEVATEEIAYQQRVAKFARESKVIVLIISSRF